MPKSIMARETLREGAVVDVWRWLLVLGRNWFALRKKPAAEKHPHSLTLTAERRETRETSRETGAYDSFEELLADLDEKFDRLRLTKFRSHRGAVGQSQLLKHLGAHICSRSTMLDIESLDPYIVQMLPAVFISSMPMPLDKDEALGDWTMLFKVSPKEFRGDVQWVRKTDTVYSIEITTSSYANKPSIHVGLAYVAVKPDGTVYELRYRDTHGRWRYSPLYDESKGNVINLFCVLANQGALRDLHWSVRAKKDGRKISFSIPDNDAPHFFRKARSKKKRIFHAVKAHRRATGSNVRTHYRGNRFFKWNGYDIEIRLPGKHMRPLTQVTRPI